MRSLDHEGLGERAGAGFALACPETQLTVTLAPRALGTPPARISYGNWRLAQAAKWATRGWAARGWAKSTFRAGKRLLPRQLPVP